MGHAEVEPLAHHCCTVRELMKPVPAAHQLCDAVMSRFAINCMAKEQRDLGTLGHLRLGSLWGRGGAS